MAKGEIMKEPTDRDLLRQILKNQKEIMLALIGIGGDIESFKPRVDETEALLLK